MTDSPDQLGIWHDHLDRHNLAAARDYLTLRVGETDAAMAVARLGKAQVTQHRVNDILRALNREPLPITDIGVMNVIRELISGGKLHPALLACGDVADGYHRLSAAYHIDPFALASIARVDFDYRQHLLQ